jgi:hypothetical protein
MEKYMKVKILVGLFALSSLTASAQVGSQQETVVLKSRQGVVTRGVQDPNIKQGMKANDPNNPAKFVKKNSAANSSSVIELKSGQGKISAVDLNIKSDETLNVKNKPKKKS